MEMLRHCILFLFPLCVNLPRQIPRPALRAVCSGCWPWRESASTYIPDRRISQHRWRTTPNQVSEMPPAR